MNISDLRGKVMTVLGPIDGEALGITLPHEHLLIDISVYFVEPETSSDKLIAHQPVSFSNLRWIKYHSRNHLDNSRVLDEEQAIKELMRFKLAGGKSLNDVTSIGLGRDPKALARISRATGINIVTGTGHYVTLPKDPNMERKTVDELTREILSDVKNGVSDTGIHCGFIGEVGCSWPLRESERKGLAAAAQAQQETGMSINVHPNRNDKGPLEAIEILRQAGADLGHVVMSHMDRCGYSLETRLKLLEAGCFVEYDLFGTEGWYPPQAAVADEALPNMLNDVGRVREIADLIGRGYLKKVLISHDICYKAQLACWGGPGYAHILENVVPLMRVYGYSDEQINTLIIRNPKELLTIR